MQQPLLRDLLRGNDWANERSAALVADAAGLEAVQLVATSLAATAGAYWDLSAAEATLQIRRASTKRLEKVAESTRTLVDKGEVAPSQLNQPLARLASGRAEVTAAQQQNENTFRPIVVMEFRPDGFPMMKNVGPGTAFNIHIEPISNPANDWIAKFPVERNTMLESGLNFCRTSSCASMADTDGIDRSSSVASWFMRSPLA